MKLLAFQNCRHYSRNFIKFQAILIVLKFDLCVAFCSEFWLTPITYMPQSYVVTIASSVVKLNIIVVLIYSFHIIIHLAYNIIYIAIIGVVASFKQYMYVTYV